MPSARRASSNTYLKNGRSQKLHPAADLPSRNSPPATGLTTSPDSLLPQVVQHLRASLLDRLAVQLVRRGEAAVFRGPGARRRQIAGHGACARDQRDGAEDLVGAEAALLADLHQVVQHQLLGGRQGADLLGLAVGDARSRRPLLQLRKVRLDEGDRPVHLAVAKAEEAPVHGVDVDGSGILLLHGLDRDVLATLQLDQILDPVNDHQGTVRCEEADITAVKPAIGVEDLLRLVHLLEVAGRHRRPPEHNFAPAQAIRAIVALVVCLVRLHHPVQDLRLAHVVEARPQFQLHACQGRADDAVSDVRQHLHGARAASFRERVALEQRHGEGGADEVLHIRADGAAARQANLEAAAQHVFQLREDKLLEERRFAALAHGPEAAGVRDLEEHLLER
mmetsp:Transcript_46528/g.149453  ORF Transcript_46528/g.149453 Transcript_46528/m.149453 type:complete len:393 (+) Transcript_46528:159-1337(+)